MIKIWKISQNKFVPVGAHCGLVLKNYYQSWNTGDHPGRCRKVAVVQRWLLTQVILYSFFWWNLKENEGNRWVCSLQHLFVSVCEITIKIFPSYFRLKLYRVIGANNALLMKFSVFLFEGDCFKNCYFLLNLG